MKTIIKKATRNPQDIHNSLQQGFGIAHPEKISGYAGFFINYGGIIASDLIYSAMDQNSFREFVYTSIRDFQDDKYGLISESDYINNIESKWLPGGGPLFGRYAYGRVFEEYGQSMPMDIIKIRMYQDNTYILFDSEPDWMIKEFLLEKGI